ncbi:hypothetical protein SAMN05216268_10599 [Streptomyces yunnanensis]|uniref:Uncharacterized protein n=1 Tax=Streptomyces yunnanensis TaxID=156453 RepID=A0A9X8MRR7_9ACTN|nr:hypothetical protein SAMN05216268_10599 [Streptomyces yunnanensis]
MRWCHNKDRRRRIAGRPPRCTSSAPLQDTSGTGFYYDVDI